MNSTLNLILSFTDRATAGMNNARNTLESLTNTAMTAAGSLSSIDERGSLMALASSANIVGNSLTSAGSKMVGVFGMLTDKIKSMGSEYENFGATLEALGGNTEKQLSKLFDFATHSSLEVGDVKEFLITLQAQGIDAFSKLKSTISGTRQETLAWITDLRSSRLDVPALRFKMALQNYIGSGEKKMMRTVFDMGDIEDIIGHGVSNTAEGRMQDIVEMVEKKGLTGLSAKLANTWEGVESNISDAFTRIYYSVANDGGVFKKLKRNFMTLARIIIDLPEDDLKNLGSTIADAMNMIISPITSMTKHLAKGIKFIINLTKTQPALAKWALVIPVVTGALLLLGGTILKIVGTFAMFSLFIKEMPRTFSVVGKATNIGITSMMSKIVPLMALVAALAYVWRNDLGGIKTSITDWVDHVHTSFRTAVDTVNSSMLDFNASLSYLNTSDNPWDKLTLSIMKLYAALTFTMDAWRDNTIPYDDWVKAKELGILPFIEGVLDVKYYMSQFAQGVKEGLDGVVSSFTNFAGKIADTFNFSGDIGDSIGSIGMMLKAITSGDVETWRLAGQVVGDMIPKIILLGIAVKGLMGISDAMMAVGTIGRGFTGIVNGGKGVIGMITGIGKGVKNLKNLKIVESIKNVIGSFGKMTKLNKFTIIVAVIGAVAIALVSLYKKSESFRNMVDSAFGKMGEVIAKVSPYIQQLASQVMQFASEALPKVMEFLAPVITGIMGMVQEMAPVFTELGSTLGNTFVAILPSLITLGKALGTLVVTIVTTLAPVIMDVISTLAPALAQILPAVGSIVTMLATALVPVITDIVGFIVQLLPVIMPVVTQIVGFIGVIAGLIANLLSTVLPPVLDFISQLITWLTPVIAVILRIAGVVVQVVARVLAVAIPVALKIVTFIVGVVVKIIGTIRKIISVVVGVVRNIIDGVRTAVGKIKDFFVGVWTKAKEIFTKVRDFILSIWDTVVEGASTIGESIADAVKGIINFALRGVFGIVNGFIEGINFVIGLVNDLPFVPDDAITLIEKLEVPQLATGGVVNQPTGAIIGEKGPEAVVPLSNNTEWTGKVAGLLKNHLNKPTPTPMISAGPDLAPVLSALTQAIYHLNSVLDNGNLTPENTSSYSGDTVTNVYNTPSVESTGKKASSSQNVDARVIFEKGSIIVQTTGDDADIDRMIDKVIKKIERRRELKKVLSYGGA